MSKDITNKANEDMLNTLHQMVAKDLIARIASGEATVQELSAAIRFLKDNEVTADVEANKELRMLEGTIMEIKELPFSVDDEEEEDGTN